MGLGFVSKASMLRNSFLMQKDYKIHADVVRLIYQPEWMISGTFLPRNSRRSIMLTAS